MKDTKATKVKVTISVTQRDGIYGNDVALVSGESSVEANFALPELEGEVRRRVQAAREEVLKRLGVLVEKAADESEKESGE